MTLGDRRYTRASAMARPTAYPEARATGDPLAGSLRSAYSYGQHAGALVAQWMAPIRPARSPHPWVSVAATSTLRMLRVNVYLPEHVDTLHASVWIGLRGTGSVLARLRGTTTGAFVTTPGAAAGPAWPADVLVSSQGLSQAVEARPSYTVSAGERGTTQRIIVDLEASAATMEIYPLSCTVWGITDGEG